MSTFIFDNHKPEANKRLIFGYILVYIGKKSPNVIVYKILEFTKSILHQLIFDIKICIFKAGDETLTLISIYDDTIKQRITEEFSMHCSAFNFPKVGFTDELKVLFTNLPEDILHHKLYIIAKMYRLGNMEAPNIFQPNVKKKHKKKQSLQFLRPYAISIINLCNSIPDLLKNHGKEFNYEPSLAPILQPNIEDDFSKLKDYIINKDFSHSSMAPLSIGIAYSLILYECNIENVKTNYKYYDQLTTINKIYCNNDNKLFYVTINKIKIDSQRNKLANNIYMQFQLRDNKTLKYVKESKICLGNGKMSWKNTPIGETPVFYHINNVIINETYLIYYNINFEELKDCHLYFSCYHVKNNNKLNSLGFTFIKLGDDYVNELITSKIYKLKLYKDDRKSLKNYITFGLNNSLKLIKNDNEINISIKF